MRIQNNKQEGINWKIKKLHENPTSKRRRSCHHQMGSLCFLISHNPSRPRCSKQNAILKYKVEFSVVVLLLLRTSLSQLLGVRMTAQEQMKKMLDELMGTKRDGEYGLKELFSAWYKQLAWTTWDIFPSFNMLFGDLLSLFYSLMYIAIHASWCVFNPGSRSDYNNTFININVKYQCNNTPEVVNR